VAVQSCKRRFRLRAFAGNLRRRQSGHGAQRKNDASVSFEKTIMQVLDPELGLRVHRIRTSAPRDSSAPLNVSRFTPAIEAKARDNRCRHSWRSRFPDPEGRESATPFTCWLCFLICFRRWVDPPWLAARRAWATTISMSAYPSAR
jgi:hypothetical protein